MQRNLHCLRGRQKKGENKEWLHHPCFLGGQKGGATTRRPMRSWGFSTNGNEIKSGYISPAFSGAKSGRNSYVAPVISGVRRIARRTIISNYNTPWRPKLGGIATQPSSSQGFPEKANLGDKIESSCITMTFSLAKKWAKMLCDPYVPGRPRKSRQNWKRQHHRWLLGRQKGGGMAAKPLNLLGESGEQR